MKKLFTPNKVTALTDPSKRTFLLAASAYWATVGTVFLGARNEYSNREVYSSRYAKVFEERYGVSLSPAHTKIANDYLRTTKRLPTALGSLIGAGIARIPQHEWRAEGDERGPFRRAEQKIGVNFKGLAIGALRAAFTSVPVGLGALNNQNETIGLGTEFAQSRMDGIESDLIALGLEQKDATIIARAAYIERVRSLTWSSAAVTVLASGATREDDPSAPETPAQ